MTRDRRVVARDLLLKAEIAPSSVMGLEGEHFLLHQDNVISLVRATLKEAARAGCWYCKNGNVAAFETDDAARSGWYHHFDDETPSETCRRGEIHDLIAALDAKADAGPTEER